MTAFKPGQSPPPVNSAIRIETLLKLKIARRKAAEGLAQLFRAEWRE